MGAGRLLVVVAAAALASVAVVAQEVELCPDAGIDVAELPGTIDSATQVEISGLGFSPQLVNGEEVLWVMSDGGNPATVEAFLTSGGGSVAVVDITLALLDVAHDVEDLAVAPCTFNANQECIFVADTGNNPARAAGVDGRVQTFLYEFPEPVLDELITPGTPLLFDTTDVAVTAVTISFDQDGITTAEAQALLVDPITRDIFLVTNFNDNSLNRLFKIDRGAFVNGNVLSLQPEPAVNLDIISNFWTKGDISKDGTTIVLGTKTQSLFWARDVEGGQTVTEAFDQEACFNGLGQPATGDQHEAITFGFEANIVYEITDEAINPDIHETVLVGFPAEPVEIVEEEEDDDGLSGEAIATIIAVSGVVVVGGAAFYVRRSPSKDGQARRSREPRKEESPKATPYPFAQSFGEPANNYGGATQNPYYGQQQQQPPPQQQQQYQQQPQQQYQQQPQEQQPQQQQPQQQRYQAPRGGMNRISALNPRAYLG